MAPTNARQLLVWSIPTIAILLSYLWFRKKRLESSKSDPSSSTSRSTLRNEKSLKEEFCEIDGTTSPSRLFSRSLSGVDTQPIDIVVPKSLRSQKSNPVVISDEDLDLEIERIKSMKNGSTGTFKRSQSTNDVSSAKRPSINENKRIEIPQETPPSPTFSSPPSPVTPKFKSPKVIKCTPQKIILSSSASPMAQKHAKHNEENFSITPKLGENQEMNFPKSKSLKSQKTKCPKNNNNNNNLKNKTPAKIIENEEISRQSVERDSANHSPSDVMLASPSLSSISDNHSEGSSDSGKGGSDVITPPSRTPAGDGSISGDVPPMQHVYYDFAVPQHLVGRLIGRGGCTISEIKEKSGTQIVVKKHLSNTKMKVCSIEGPQMNIDRALQIIRDKFPSKRYPDITLEQIQYPPITLTPDQLHLKLVEGINNDTIISCMVAPNHFFLQQPTHPTFPNLHVLTNYMNICYSNTDTPLLPNPIVENTICAAQSEGDWYRAMVLSTDAETTTSHVIFLDYGGYNYIENSNIRQIRGDFLLLPFQAAECILANIRPTGGRWRDEAYSIVAELTKGALAYTQVADYTSDGVPLVLVYIFIGPQEVVFLNEELVNRGLAEWITHEEEGAVGGVTT